MSFEATGPSGRTRIPARPSEDGSGHGKTASVPSPLSGARAVSGNSRLPAPTPELTKSLTPSQYDKHSAEIVASVKACLGNYWQAPEDRQADALRMADWIAALEDWPIAEIQDALREWVMENPSRRPNFGHISAKLKEKRGKAWAERKQPEPEPVREPVSKERAAEIMAQVGYTPRRMTPVED